MSSATSHADLANSPIIYLFGGLAAILGLIASSLIILICTNRKVSTISESDAIEKAPKLSLPTPEMEPKIVVIMAGDYMPTFLAKPISSTQHHQHRGRVGSDSRKNLNSYGYYEMNLPGNFFVKKPYAANINEEGTVTEVTKLAMSSLHSYNELPEWEV
ncbi:hypothetical protein FRX31_030487, partial [Thalictrum thalictroides]